LEIKKRNYRFEDNNISKRYYENRRNRGNIKIL